MAKTKGAKKGAARGAAAKSGEWARLRLLALVCMRLRSSMRSPLTAVKAPIAKPKKKAAAAKRKGGGKRGVEAMAFAKVYPLYVAKAERKQRTQGEVDTIIAWLTGYSEAALAALAASETTFATFFSDAPQLNPLRHAIKGKVCGVQVEALEGTMREVRFLDKLIDELAKGKAMDKILRTG